MILYPILPTSPKYLQLPPTADKFPMDALRNIYIVSLNNDDTSLASTAVQLIRDKQKRAISSSVILTLAQRHPYALTSLEKIRAIFEQGRFLLEPTIRYHEVFYTIIPEKPSNFG